MSEPTVPASVFKARCLALLDEVATTHRSLVVTKHGVPVARVVPIEHSTLGSGSVTLLADDDSDYFTAGTFDEDSWDADR
ncbi:MAG: type II toxin-antitoxin system Phd/YefM family antitoxin [Actinobacteria bacterium]|jgi:prevent-host-death family protein|nr:type II toxin-antitoxin system Phd/YefM family antitoxin [Acidimicrobiaceae bacterium]MBP7891128.1 type II toxin-antitoxin system Phd/YefM family antitoxin [Ilumatobacteraceae bacterium]NMD25011.1 type II toxin-antitoxin system Phd/YefM family antitoxin [Actinomycetota bacterium]MBP8211989.1 type II toxin-antitoxin system Phd/YefM family antitoxin [Ilumatobacteraceae bacterium]HAN33955.1 type II toxin-antitoxin system prevent-host-death family antitoxin [Acidimicrobiaceae bacterium]